MEKGKKTIVFLTIYEYKTTIIQKHPLRPCMMSRKTNEDSVKKSILFEAPFFSLRLYQIHYLTEQVHRF